MTEGQNVGGELTAQQREDLDRLRQALEWVAEHGSGGLEFIGREKAGSLALTIQALSTSKAQLQEGETRATLDVLAERQRQIEVEGWTPEHDDEHAVGELALAASCYASIAGRPDDVRVNFPRGRPQDRWPWDKASFKPKSRREDLLKAGALILAEIERLDRKGTRDEH